MRAKPGPVLARRLAAWARERWKAWRTRPRNPALRRMSVGDFHFWSTWGGGGILSSLKENMTGADLRGADLGSVSLFGAILVRAKLERVNMERAVASHNCCGRKMR